jgi:glycosyltransferase involved in cell wall biosynthesis
MKECFMRDMAGGKPDGQTDRNRIVIVTDAWRPQVNGVVRTLEMTAAELRQRGYDVTFITPEPFWSLPCPTYPEIRLSLVTRYRVGQMIAAARPNYIHISTEGPLGLAARNYCVSKGLAFTTAFHTKFPEYVHARIRVPINWSYRFIHWFHRASETVMCATPSIAVELADQGIVHTQRWSRGVDVDLFRPDRHEAPKELDGLAHPILLYVGRVTVEKNIEDFLEIRTTGTKVVVGSGPQLAALKARYPDAHFMGPRYGEDLAAFYAAADVFVFPSRTDTFGLVLLEALASGTPVAAYPAPGPVDVIGTAPVGVLNNDLERAVKDALGISGKQCRDYALNYTWAACTDQFLANLSPVETAVRPALAVPA